MLKWESKRKTLKIFYDPSPTYFLIDFEETPSTILARSMEAYVPVPPVAIPLIQAEGKVLLFYWKILSVINSVISLGHLSYELEGAM